MPYILDVNCCIRPVSATHPIWLTHSNSSSLDSCIGHGNNCSLASVTTCTHLEDVTIECGN